MVTAEDNRFQYPHRQTVMARQMGVNHMTERWVTLTDAAKELDKSVSSLTRLVRNKHIETKPDPVDSRVKLVNIEALKQLFAVRYRKPQE
jgi:hypothetical protein